MQLHHKNKKIKMETYIKKLRTKIKQVKQLMKEGATKEDALKQVFKK
jgi:hypothetical protein